MRIALITVGSILGLFILIFLSNEFEIFGMKLWGVRKENARREIYENTQSYVQGKKQELVKLHHEWMQAKTEDDKKIIEATVRHQFSEFDENKIDIVELYQFLKKCKYN